MQRHSEKYLKGAMVLMAAVVLLPSVALLWFVSKTIENEKYALQKKLTNQYVQLVQGKQLEVMVQIAKQTAAWKEKIANLKASEAEEVDLETIGQAVDQHLGEIRQLRKAQKYKEATDRLQALLQKSPIRRWSW